MQFGFRVELFTTTTEDAITDKMGEPEEAARDPNVEAVAYTSSGLPGSA